jgi:ribonuclease R
MKRQDDSATDLRERLLSYLADPESRPSSGRELMRQLRVGSSQRESFRRLLRELVDEGALRRLKGNRYRLAQEKRLATGRLSTHRDGYGFVETEGVEGPDIFVRRRNMGGALHKDRVQVQVIFEKGGGRAEGRITRVLERARHRLTGILRQAESGLVVTPYGAAPYEEVRIPSGAAGAGEDGMVVGIELFRYPSGNDVPEGKVVEVMGSPDEPGMDLKIIIRKYGLRDAFPPEVEEAAGAVPDSVREEDRAGREDFRDLVTVTIDGETARDFDDAISIRRRGNGTFTLWVHIADVSHYVQEGSPIDLEARERGTSVYFPERALHMLPERLSTGICSLKPGVDRLCQTCVMEIDEAGEITGARIAKGVIRSDRRMTYTEVARCLEGDAAECRRQGDLVEPFRLMEELCGRLRGKREQRGSIDFDLPEPVILLDDRGEMTGITPLERNIAHQLIEEFMLAANEAVAVELVEREWPAMFRIHDKPDPGKLAELDAVVKTFGFALPQPFDEISPKDIQLFLKSVTGRPEEDALQRIVLRSMMRAAYSEVFGLHFGLATRRYLHFTSPIRRYPDLIVHRTLSESSTWGRAGRQEKATRRKVLHDLALHASERERNADAAEWELIDWKKVGFMLDRVGEEHEAIVSGVVSFGLFVELEDLYIDGLVHISTLEDDYYRFIETKHLLVGERTGRRFKIGDEVRVVVDKVNALTKKIDFRLVSSPRRSR